MLRSCRPVECSALDVGSVGMLDVDDSVVCSLSPDYVDLGCCRQVCEFCGAFFLFEERLKGVRVSSRPSYIGCCMGGKVVLD